MLFDFENEGDRAVTVENLAEATALARPKLVADLKATQEVRGFEIPGKVWATMFAAYALFFAGLLVATGRDGFALFALAISVCFAVMYFATATILNGVGQTSRPMHSSLAKGKGIETISGWMSNGAAYAQILTIPLSIALFAWAIAVIRASV